MFFFLHYKLFILFSYMNKNLIIIFFNFITSLGWIFDSPPKPHVFVTLILKASLSSNSTGNTEEESFENTDQEPSESPNQEPSENPDQEPSENPNEKPSENPNEKPSENSNEDLEDSNEEFDIGDSNEEFDSENSGESFDYGDGEPVDFGYAQPVNSGYVEPANSGNAQPVNSEDEESIDDRNSSDASTQLSGESADDLKEYYDEILKPEHDAARDAKLKEIEKKQVTECSDSESVQMENPKRVEELLSDAFRRERKIGLSESFDVYQQYDYINEYSPKNHEFVHADWYRSEKATARYLPDRVWEDIKPDIDKYIARLNEIESSKLAESSKQSKFTNQAESSKQAESSNQAESSKLAEPFSEDGYSGEDEYSSEDEQSDKAESSNQAEASNQNPSDDISSPLDQFNIQDFIVLNLPLLGDLKIFITNITLYLALACLLVFLFNIIDNNAINLIRNKWSIIKKSIYDTINSIVRSQINNKKGQSYFPFIYILFLFILTNNLIGMIPYSFASTSHFILTFSLSFSIVLGATLLGFQKHKLKLFSLFVPAGCPLALLPLLVIIEFISYLARNISLGLRLAANILSGHMLLNILSGFTYNIMNYGFIYFFLGLLPLAFILAFSALELGIAFIQAQVFVVLSSSYIKDGLDLH